MPGLKDYYQTRIRDARNLSTGLLMTESGSFFLQQRVRPELEKLGPPHDQPCIVIESQITVATQSRNVCCVADRAELVSVGVEGLLQGQQRDEGLPEPVWHLRRMQDRLRRRGESTAVYTPNRPWCRESWLLKVLRLRRWHTSASLAQLLDLKVLVLLLLRLLTQRL